VNVFLSEVEGFAQSILLPMEMKQSRKEGRKVFYELPPALAGGYFVLQKRL